MSNRLNFYQNKENTLKNQGIVPARLDANQAAEILGFSGNDIPILVSGGLLKPLGKPAPNAVKYFAACEIQKFSEDLGWLNKATQAAYNYWKEKNQRKGSKGVLINPVTNTETALAV